MPWIAIAWVVIAPLVTIAWHESAHALFALSLTRGPVLLSIGRQRGRAVGRIGRLAIRVSPLPDGGFCAHHCPERRADEALIAAAGPVSSILLAAAAWDLHQTSTAGRSVTLAIAVTSLVAAATTAFPTDYSLESERAGTLTPSDGMTVVVALRPHSRLARRASTPRRVRRPIPEHVPGEPGKAIRAPFAAVLAAVALLSFYLNFELGVGLVVLFALAWPRGSASARRASRPRSPTA